MTTRRTAAIQLAWLMGGCSNLLAPVDTSVSTALIDQLPGDVPRAVRARGVLRVQPPTCRPVYDTTRMAYSLEPHRIEFFARHEWAERPAEMLQPLLVRTLQAAGCCAAVVTWTGPAPPDFSLRTDIGELVQDFAAEPARLRLKLRIAVSARAGPVVARDIEYSQPMRARNAEAGIQAANEAVAKALRAIAQAVIDAIAA